MKQTMPGVARLPDAHAVGRSDPEARNVATVLRLFDDGWGARPGWEAVWSAVLSEEVETYFHAFPPNRGRAAAIAFNRDLFSGFPELQVQVCAVIAEGDAVVVRSQLTGCHTGSFLGVPASGATVDVPDVTLFRVEDGRVMESRYFTDLMAVMTTIGALPPQ